MRDPRIQLGTAGAFVLAGVVTLHACEPEVPADAGTDAAMDAPPPRDAPRARDAPVDTPPDGYDAIDEEAEWVPLEGLPEECQFATARNPEALFTVAWEPCRDVPGCTQIGADERWEKRLFHAADTQWHDGSRGYFSVILGREVAESIDVLADTDGRVYAAFHAVDPLGIGCVRTTSMSDGQALHVVEALDTNDPDLPGPRRVFSGSLDTIGMRTAPYFVADTGLLLPGNNVPNSRPSRSLLGLLASPSRRLYLVDATAVGSAPAWASRGGFAQGGGVQDFEIVGDEAVWLSWGDEFRVMTGSLTREQTKLFELPGVQLAWLDADEHDVAWVAVMSVAPGGVATELDLWTAPFTTDSATFAARRVLALRGNGGMGRVGDGLYAYSYYEDASPPIHHLWVVDLETGQERHLALTRDWNVANIAWVTRDEIAFSAVIRDVHSVVRRTLARIQLSELDVVR